MKDFRNLKVWQKGHQFVLAVYKVSAGFPKEELYGLTSQIRRSCASIPTNIAEGCCRGTDAEFSRFVQIAMGSASETEYQLLLAHDLGYLPTKDYETLSQQIIEIKQMITALLKKADSRPLNADSY